MNSKEFLTICGLLFGLGLYAGGVILLCAVAAFAEDNFTAILVLGILLMSTADSILDGPVAKAIRECIADRRTDD